jgi:hypothetical protein
VDGTRAEYLRGMSSTPPQHPGQPDEPADQPDQPPASGSPFSPPDTGYGQPASPSGPPPGSDPPAPPYGAPPAPGQQGPSYAPPGTNEPGSPFGPPPGSGEQGAPYGSPPGSGGPGSPFGPPGQSPQPYGGGYAPGPAYPGSPGYPSAPAGSSGTDGFALAGFVLSLLSCVPLGVIFSIVGLSRTGKNSAKSGRGLAIAGLIVSGVWVVLGILAVVAAVMSQPQRDSSGRVTDEGSTSALSIRPGDCLADAGLGRTTSVNLVPCTQPHGAQALAAFDVTATRYPGDVELQRMADEGCSTRVQDDADLMQRIGDGELTVHFYYPDATAFGRGERTVTCLVVAQQGQLTETFPVR